MRKTAAALCAWQGPRNAAGAVLGRRPGIMRHTGPGCAENAPQPPRNILILQIQWRGEQGSTYPGHHRNGRRHAGGHRRKQYLLGRRWSAESAASGPSPALTRRSFRCRSQPRSRGLTPRHLCQSPWRAPWRPLCSMPLRQERKPLPAAAWRSGGSLTAWGSSWARRWTA